jgi:NAD(P)-dependent dehydrogenase (short-subunit alcohol dehydrogenase family)
MTNLTALNGKNLLVTGAASGIGRATAVLLSHLGATVACADIDAAGLEETRHLLHDDSNSLHVRNLKDLDGIASWLAEIVQHSGPLHGFVHAAGLAAPWPLRTLSANAWRDVFLINTEAALVLTQAFSGRKIYAGENASVVFISSVMARVGSPAASAYSMTKSGLEGMARSLALELAPKRIRVNCVAPGFVRTPMFDRVEQQRDFDYRARIEALHPLGLGQPDDVAYAAAFLLSDAARWITGTVLVVDGGYTAQ